jgi:hypothetical protein
MIMKLKGEYVGDDDADDTVTDSKIEPSMVFHKILIMLPFCNFILTVLLEGIVTIILLTFIF